jgi:hypothetical protein
LKRQKNVHPQFWKTSVVQKSDRKKRCVSRLCVKNSFGKLSRESKS